MPLYEYQSDDGAIIEKIFSMKEEKPVLILENGKEYHRVWGNFSINDKGIKKPKYLGDLADKNTAEKIKRGEIKKKKKFKPWWRKKDKVDSSLMNMTAKQKINYIKTGKK